MEWIKLIDEIVSIHAPVPGATGAVFTICGGTTVSIHAPVPGATVTAENPVLIILQRAVSANLFFSPVKNVPF